MGATEGSTTRVHNGVAYRMPKLQMGNSDLSRLINSDEVQSKINALKEGTAPAVLKSNPLKSATAMAALNPYHAEAKKKNAAAQAAAEKAKKAKKSIKKVSKAVAAGKTKYYKSMIAKE